MENQRHNEDPYQRREADGLNLMNPLHVTGRLSMVATSASGAPRHVIEIEAEQSLVAANRELITRFEHVKKQILFVAPRNRSRRPSANDLSLGIRS